MPTASKRKSNNENYQPLSKNQFFTKLHKEAKKFTQRKDIPTEDVEYAR